MRRIKAAASPFIVGGEKMAAYEDLLWLKNHA
jgi:hypothetical protein